MHAPGMYPGTCQSQLVGRGSTMEEDLLYRADDSQEHNCEGCECSAKAVPGDFHHVVTVAESPGVH
eukprot:6223183-Prymnesium_polylepis.1